MFLRVAVLLPFLMAGLLVGCEKTSPDALVARAEQSFLNKNYRAAILDLKEALKLDSKSARARWLLGEVYLATEDGASAEKEIRQAGVLGVGGDSVAPALVRALFLQRKYDEVLAFTAEGNLSSESTGEIAALRALASLEKGQLGPAKAMLEQAVASGSSSDYVDFARASLLTAEGAIDEALQVSGLINSRSPTFAPAWTLRGDLLGRQRKYEEAEAAYTRAIESRVVKRNDLLKRAFARLAQNQLDQAGRDAADLIASAPKFQPGYYLSGLVHFQKGELEPAAESLGRSIEMVPEHFQTVFLLALVNTRLGQISSALQLAEQAVAMQPGFVKGRELLAVLYIQQRRGADAEGLVRPIVAARPQDLEAKNLLASSLMLQQKWDESARLLQEIAMAETGSVEAQLRAGVGALVAGEADAGIDALERAIGIAPNDPAVNAALIAGLIGKQASDEALAAADRFFEQRPEDPEALNLLAAAQLAAGDRPAALATYGQALSKDPGNLQASQVMASLALAQNDLGAALTYLGNGLDRHPNDLALLLMQAHLAQRNGDAANAEAVLQHAVESHPEAPDPRVRLARLYLQQNELERALSMLTGSEIRQSPDLLGTRAQISFRLNRLREAKADLELLARLMPRSVDAQKSLAMVYDALGDTANLERALDRILELAPDDPRTNVAKARLLILRGAVKEAEQVLNAAGLPADDPDMLTTRVSLARRAGDSAGEIRYATALLEQRPGSVSAVALSRAYHRARDFRNAQRVLSEWLAGNPKDLVARVELANLYAAMGSTDASIGELRRIVEIDPVNTFALNNLAWHLRQDSPAEALRFATTAHKQEPGSVAVMDTLALVYAYNADYPNALRTIARAIDTDPQKPTLRLRRAEILAMSADKAGAATELKQLLSGSPPEPTKSKAQELLLQVDDTDEQRPK